MSVRDGGYTLCLCLNVSYDDIKRAVARGAGTFEEIQQMTGFGKSCSMCTAAIKMELDTLLRRQGPKMPDVRRGGGE